MSRENVPIVVPSCGAAAKDEIRRPHASGAGHVLHHQVGLPGICLAEMARQQARIDVIAAARSKADHSPLMSLPL